MSHGKVEQCNDFFSCITAFLCLKAVFLSPVKSFLEGMTSIHLNSDALVYLSCQLMVVGFLYGLGCCEIAEGFLFLISNSQLVIDGSL